jgi:hypothetical protein
MSQLTARDSGTPVEVSVNKKSCLVAACGQGGKIRRGMCGKHYWRWSNHGDPLVTINLTNQQGLKCPVDGCERKRFSLTYCEMHYRRFRSHADFNATPRAKRRILAD